MSDVGQRRCEGCKKFFLAVSQKTLRRASFSVWFFFVIGVVMSALAAYLLIVGSMHWGATLGALFGLAFVLAFGHDIFVGKVFYAFRDKTGNIHMHNKKPAQIGNFFYWLVPEDPAKLEEFRIPGLIVRLPFVALFRRPKILNDRSGGHWRVEKCWWNESLGRVELRICNKLGTQNDESFSGIRVEQALDLINGKVVSEAAWNVLSTAVFRGEKLTTQAETLRLCQVELQQAGEHGAEMRKALVQALVERSALVLQIHRLMAAVLATKERFRMPIFADVRVALGDMTHALGLELEQMSEVLTVRLGDEFQEKRNALLAKMGEFPELLRGEELVPTASFDGEELKVDKPAEQGSADGTALGSFDSTGLTVDKPAEDAGEKGE